MNRKIKAGIVGCTGYTGQELMHLLLLHPQIEIAMAYSRKESGKSLAHFFFESCNSKNIIFTDQIAHNCDVIFVCLPHGQSKKFIEQNNLFDLCPHIIDLSADYRFESNNFTYGLTDCLSNQSSPLQHVAVPGCFATAIQIGLLPFLKSNLCQSSIHISAMTGATGAGAQLSETTHYSWRHDNLSLYKIFEHQHLEEIYFNLSNRHQLNVPEIFWVPMRGCFTRGILASIYFKCESNLENLIELFDHFYKNSISVIRSNNDICLKQVINTNLCLVQLKKYKEQLHITVVLDNLLKGSAGQAIENMNLLFELPKNSGLQLKPSLF